MSSPLPLQSHTPNTKVPFVAETGWLSLLLATFSSPWTAAAAVNDYVANERIPTGAQDEKY